MTKRITIPYFPKSLQYIAPVLMGAGVYLIIMGYPVWGLVLVLSGAVILRTRYVTEINLTEKRYKDYISMLWVPLNMESDVFTMIDRIVVSKENHAQMINTRSTSRQLDWADYTGTLLFDQGKTLDLLTRNDKRELLLGLKDFAGFLNVDVEDRTTPRHYWVDLAKVE